MCKFTRRLDRINTLLIRIRALIANPVGILVLTVSTISLASVGTLIWLVVTRG